MKRKILANVLTLCMLFSMIPMTAFATGGTGEREAVPEATAAILHDTRTTDTPSIKDTDLYVNYSARETASTEAGVDKLVTLTADGLRQHKNADTPSAKMGYWAGVAIPAPTSATHMKALAKLSLANLTNDNFEKEEVTVITPNVAAGNKGGFVQYLDVADASYADNDAFYVMIQWYSSENTAIGSKATVYKVDFSGVKTAVPSITAVGFAQNSADAVTGIATDMKAQTGMATTNAGKDSANKTMWVVLKDLPVVASSAGDKNYQVVVNGPDNQALAIDTEKSGSDKIGPGTPFNSTTGFSTVYWTFDRTMTSGSIVNKDIAVGDYRFQLQEKSGTTWKNIGDPVKLNVFTKANGDDTIYASAETAPVLTVAGDTGADILGKNASEIQGKLTVTANNAAKKITVTGDSYAISGWTAFSSVTDQQSGNYVALKLHNDKDAKMTITSSSEQNAVKVVPNDDTLVINLKNIKATADGKDTYVTTVNVGGVDWTIDLTGVNQKAAPVATALNVVPVTGSVLEKNATDLQGALDIKQDGNTIKITGDVKYLAKYEGFGTNQDGHYIALRLTSGAGNTLTFSGSSAKPGDNAIDSDGIVVWRLENFSTKIATVKVTPAGEGATAVPYTIDMTGVNLVAPTVKGVAKTANQPSWFTVNYNAKSGITSLSGAAVFADNATTTDVKLTVTYGDNTSDVEKTADVTVTLTKGANNTVTASQVTFQGKALNIDASGLYVDAGNEAKPDVADPVVPEVTKGQMSDTEFAKADDIKNKLSDRGSVGVALDNVSKQVANNEETTVVSELSKVTVPAAPDGQTRSGDLDKIAEAKAAPTDETKTGEVNLVVQVYMEVAVTDVSMTNSTVNNVSFDITPKSQKILTTVDPTDGSNTAIKVLDGTNSNIDEANAIKVGEAEKIDISAPTDVTLKLPTGVLADGTVYITHEKENPSKTYYYEGDASTSAGVSTLTFTSLHGFSKFTASNTTSCVAKIGGEVYATLAEAVAAAKDGDIIELLKDADTATVSGDTRTFYIKNNGHEFTIAGAVDNGDGTYRIAYTAPSQPSNPGGGGGASATVNTSSTTGGKFTVDNRNAKKGDTVTITTTPDNGKKVASVVVTDKNGNNITVTDAGNGKYTFVMPDTTVTVKVTFVDEEKGGFTDVPADAYYADAVKWAVDKGITNGLTATTFGPNNSCTRGQMVTFLWRAAGSPAATGTNSFTDVASGEYYYNAVLWAVEKGITNGTTATTFSPNATVNRGQTVTFLYRYAESPAATGTSSFTDVAADAYYADAVKWAVAEGITNGTSDTTFAPASNCTRGQIVTFLYRQMAE